MTRITKKYDPQAARRAWFVACCDHGIDDDARRDIQAQVCGKDSASKMTDRDFRSCIAHVSGKPAFKPSDKPMVRKIFALWKALHLEGKTASGTRSALRVFCARMVGLKDSGATIDPEHLTPEQARSVVEALKAMQRRPLKTEDHQNV